MSKENTNIDTLLQSAQEKIERKKAEQELKEKDRKEKVIQLISDLDMRWKKVSTHQRSSVIPFVSDLEIKNSSIESLGFTPELMDSGDLEENETEMLRKSVQKLKDEISEKKKAVKASLKSDVLSEEERGEIQKAWKNFIEESKSKQMGLEKAFFSKQTEALGKKENYEQAQKNQKEFIQKYRGHDAPKMNGKSLFEKLVTDGDDAEWFYDNLLTKEEQDFVDELKENRKEEKDVLLQNHIFDTATLRTTERVREEVEERLEKTLGVKESLDELFALGEEDKAIFDAAKEYIEKTFGKEAWNDLEQRAQEQLKASQEDIDDWKENKKGFGKNTRKNRKGRLVRVAEPLRKEKQEKDNTLSKNLDVVYTFLEDLYSKRYRFDDNRENISIGKVQNGNEVSEELQAVVQQLEKKRERDLYNQIISLEQSTFLDQAKDHEMAQKLEELRTYISRRKKIISELKDLRYEKQQEFWKTSACIAEILDKFPLTPDDYEEEVKKQRK